MSQKYRASVTPPVVTIRAFREFAGLSLEAAARRITAAGFTITKSGLGNIETGTRGPSQEFLEAWARAFGVSETPTAVDRPPRATATRGES